MADRDERLHLDAGRPAAARRYNYLLGGKDNFSADRAAGDDMRDKFPEVTVAVAENRKVVLRAVGHLAAQLGVRQFVDLGFGLPHGRNVHEVAQDVDPAARVLYVDNDPHVLVHGRALMQSSPEGRVDFLQGDIRRADEILASTQYRTLIDPAKPVALLLFAVLHFIADDQHARRAMQTLITAMPAGSFVAVTHGTVDFLTREQLARVAPLLTDDQQGTLRPRTRDEIAAFFPGLELVDPGIVATIAWHPELDPAPDENSTVAAASVYAVLARKT